MSQTSPRILIIDDDRSTSKLISQVLSSRGYKCAVAGSAGEGLDTFFRWKPDLLIIDFLMPGKDGSTLAREIKTSETGQAVKVILISSVIKSPVNRLRMKNASNADVFLFKPLKAEELLAAVQKLVAFSPWVTSRTLHGLLGENSLILN